MHITVSKVYYPASDTKHLEKQWAIAQIWSFQSLLPRKRHQAPILSKGTLYLVIVSKVYYPASDTKQLDWNYSKQRVGLCFQSLLPRKRHQASLIFNHRGKFLKRFPKSITPQATPSALLVVLKAWEILKFPKSITPQATPSPPISSIWSVELLKFPKSITPQATPSQEVDAYYQIH